MVVTDEKPESARSVLILTVTESRWKLIWSLTGLGGSNEVYVESGRDRSFPEVISRRGSHATGSHLLPRRRRSRGQSSFNDSCRLHIS